MIISKINLPNTQTGAKQILVTTDKGCFVVSSLAAAFDTHKPETLVFRSDALGMVSDFTAVAGGMYKSPEEAILDLEARLETDSLESAHSEHAEEWLESGGLKGFIKRIWEND